MAGKGKPKGLPKSGGMKKGYKTEPVKKAQELFVQTLEGQVPYINDAFEELRKESPSKYLEIFAKYAQYFVPRKTDITSDGQKVSVPIIQIMPKEE